MIAAAVASFVGTFLMGWLAKYPFALAPGVGIVPFFAYSVVRSMGISWQFGMMAVFVEGIIFLLCTVVLLREKLFHAIPLPLKTAIGVGIGLFIAWTSVNLVCGRRDRVNAILFVFSLLFILKYILL